jgi:nitroimidazol reductase NimA-like FMN-containing flavoprotein (pyridoxamine 5'-phosphate oxidase superfamily)
MVIQEMTKSECLRALAGARLGRLACAHENQPYVVPIYFVCEEPYLYGFTTAGQKVEWMRSNPLVCVELDDVDEHDQWLSVVVFGRYEELPETPEGEQTRQLAHGPGRRTYLPPSTEFGEQERQHAHELLQRHAGWWEPGCACRTQGNPPGPVRPVFYRILIERITGRRATTSRSGPHRSSARSAVRECPSWLRDLFHALGKPFFGWRGIKSSNN